MTTINLNLLQVAFFFSRPLKYPSSDLAMKINKELPNLFGAIPPYMFPMDGNAPPNVPLFELNASNGQFKCTVSKNRADIYYTPLLSDFEKNFEFHKNLYSEKVDRFCGSLQNLEDGLYISRVGHVTDYFLLEKNPANYLKEIYMRKSFPVNLFELSIRYNIKEAVGSFNINNITRLEPGKINKTQEPGILIQRDINTLAEFPYKFDLSLFNEFNRVVEPLITLEKLQGIIS